VGEEKADEVVKLITTSLSQYNTSEEYFNNVRIALGNYLEAEKG